MNEIIKYSTEGVDSLEVRIDEETVWLSLNQLSNLFQRDKSVISRHLKNVFQTGELMRDSVVANFATTALDGKTYQVEHFSLDAIISVGYRVNSIRGTQFRIWASNVLKEHLLKGYTVKQPATVEQLNALRSEIEQILERQDKMDTFVFEEFGQVYALLTELTSQKKLQEEQQPRRKIGFQHYLEPKS